MLTIAGLAPEHGGPSQSVPALAMALGSAGVTVELVACESAPGQRAALVPDTDQVRTTLLPMANRSSRWRAGGNDFLHAIRTRCRPGEACVIHDNGLWLPSNHAVAVAARATGCPLVLSPRGMLTPWAKRHRGWKKWLAWQLYQRRDVGCAHLLHATSSDEAEKLRNLGLRTPVVVVPNGVELPPWQAPTVRPDDRRTLLFLSRLHPVKGLMTLVQAWAQCRPAGWRVLLAGKDEQGHQAELQAALRQAGVERDFEFLGEVAPAARWEVYRRGDLFVLPSHSENFGLAIAEALACGVPVITTQNTPWESLHTARCGWWVAAGPAPLSEALRAATALSDAERQHMGQRGRALVERDYSWGAVAGQMVAAYQCLLGGHLQ